MEKVFVSCSIVARMDRSPYAMKCNTESVVIVEPIIPYSATLHTGYNSIENPKIPRFLKRLIPFFLLFYYSTTIAAEPWFTGPILAPAGQTIPRGHSSLEIYGFSILNKGFYNRQWKLVHTPSSESNVLNPIFSHGLTDKLDLQFSLPYAYNRNRQGNAHGVGDVIAVLGYQLLNQNQSLWQPDLRVTLQEIIPTGRYQKLAPLSNGVAATGSGSYQTALSFNFQHLTPLFENHYLRTRLSLYHLRASSVYLTGLNSYGGSFNTDGRIWPGNATGIDVAGELTLTQNWVAVIESYIARRQKTHFKGYVGFDNDGKLAQIGHRTIEGITLAPALEYNFSPNLGIIGGSWFTPLSKDELHFISYVVALSASW